MDKGIFYLVCSVVICATVALSAVAVVRSVKTQCVGKVAVVKQVVMVTPSATPTATPTAAFKFVPKVVTPVK